MSSHNLNLIRNWLICHANDEKDKGWGEDPRMDQINSGPPIPMMVGALCGIQDEGYNLIHYRMGDNYIIACTCSAAPRAARGNSERSANTPAERTIFRPCHIGITAWSTGRFGSWDCWVACPTFTSSKFNP